MIQLRKYEAKWEKDAENISKLSSNQNARSVDPDMKKHFQELFKEWLEEIDKYLVESENTVGKPKNKDVGPRSETRLLEKENAEADLLIRRDEVSSLLNSAKGAWKHQQKLWRTVLKATFICSNLSGELKI